MPDGKVLKDKDFMNFLQQIKIIGVSESANDYNAVNRITGDKSKYAYGKYQYLASHLPEIQKTARKYNYTVPKNMDEFLANPQLQEEYFTEDQYKAYQWANNKIDSKNPFNYNLAELAALRHFQGEGGANKILETGKHRGKTKINPSTKEYIENTFRNNLIASNNYANPITEKNKLRSREGSVNSEQKKKIQNEYFDTLKKIKSLNLDPIVENEQIRNLNQKFYDEGNLEIVNQKIDYRNQNKFKHLQNLRVKANKVIIGKDNTTRPAISPAERKELEELEKQYDSMLYSKDPKFTKRFKKDPRINLNSYEREIQTNTPEPEPEEETLNDAEKIISGNTSAAVSSSTAETVQPKTRLDDSEISQMFLDRSFTPSEGFEYTPGNFDIPLDALGGLVAGIQGVRQGDVEIPMRTDTVSDGLRNYAAELAQISEMGLPPEIEGDLKNKLAEAYQTGLSNISRASNGNRNLILGNQGQLDNARMNAIAEIAVMDIDRRDRAMAAYGEVVKYINDFNNNRDAINNERKYTESMKQQQAGAALAAAGFSSFMESLRVAKENAPGSENDMLRQYMMYSISGFNPNKPDDGSPGTKSYIDSQRKIQQDRRTEKENIMKYYNSADKSTREDIAKLWFENPNLRPDQNRDVKFSDFKAALEGTNGISENKEVISNEQGVPGAISLSEMEIDNDKPMTETSFPQLSALPSTNPVVKQASNSLPNIATDDMDKAIRDAQYSAGKLQQANASPLGIVQDASSQALIDKMKSLNEKAEQLLPQTNAKTQELDKLTEDTIQSTNKIKSYYN